MNNQRNDMEWPQMEWDNMKELGFEQLLESSEYDAASQAVFTLARTAYRMGYQRATLDWEYIHKNGDEKKSGLDCGNHLVE